MRYVRDDERQMEGLSRDRLDMFLKTYYQPKLSGFSAVGRPIETFFEFQGIVQLRQKMSNPDGRTITLDIAALESEDGPKVTALMSSLFFNACSAEVPPNSPPPSGIGKFQFWLKVLEQNHDQLQATGISGLMLAKGAGMEAEFNTWDQLAANFRARIAKASGKTKA